MVRYLNNRRQKNQSSNGQEQGQMPNGPQPSQPQNQGNGQQSQSSASNQAQDSSGQEQTPSTQDSPTTARLSTLWQMVKKLLTYHPMEMDDTFSLGGRRIEQNPIPQPGGQNGNSQAVGQIGQAGVGSAQKQRRPGQIVRGSAPRKTQGPQGSQGSQGNQGQQGGQALQGNQKPQGGPGQEASQYAQGQGPQGNQGPQGGQGPQSGQGPQGNPVTANQQNQTANQGQVVPSQQPGDLQLPPPSNTAPFFQLPQNNPALNTAGRTIRHTQQGGTPPGMQPVPVEDQIHFELDKNLEHVKRKFNMPINKGFTIREFLIGFETPSRAFILFTEGLADKTIIDNFILKPLMVLSGLDRYSPLNPMAVVKERLVTANQVEEKFSFTEAINSVLMGSTALFVDRANSVLLTETKGWEHRPVGTPLVENVVRGPQEAFNEVMISNVALVRSRLRTENLVSEMFKVGNLSKADVAVMYLKDLANPAIVQEVRRRLEAIRQNVNYVPDTGMLEQFIEDDPLSPMPQTLTTERPDRVAAFLAEGHVAILMSSTPFAMIVPVNFWGLLHSPEDIYVRWPYGSLMRIIRVISLLVALLFPALYIAIVNYHQSMIPPDLLYAVAAARERVPFPAVVEVLLMDFSFELIREAGIRIPSVIGSTIGIVGALILGQAAVQADLITPPVIILVALTGLSSFAIPNYNLSFQIRILRFVYLAAAAMAGFLGVGILMVVHMCVLSSTKSFGMPVLAPASPNRPSKDTVLRAPLFRMESVSNTVRPLKSRREPKVARSWDPASQRQGGEKDG
ncbi:MAG TPA: spore germination protein [Desulfobacteria bacterium]|nr:spore germination protein [Desulfobacteria bacterium]